MRLLSRRRFVGLLAAAVAILTLAAGGVAIANHRPGHVTLAGGGVLVKRIQTDTVAVTTNSQPFVTLSGSGVTFRVPSGTTRLFEARFHAESRCSGGGAGNWCTARIVVRNNSTGSLAELRPASGTDFAFDSVAGADDFWEGNAIERSRRLGAGSYTFFVQRRTTSAATFFRLDDWHFAVEMHT